MKLYMKTTKDKFELPLAVADTAAELGRMTGHSTNTIQSMISHQIRGWYRVDIGDKDDMTMTDKEIVRNFQQAKNKRQQIEILADLNETDKETIKNILRENGAIGKTETKPKAVIISERPLIEAADPVPGEMGYVAIKHVEKKGLKGIVSREEAEKKFSESRIRDIIYAMHRFYECEQDIPEEWKAELKERL